MRIIQRYTQDIKAPIKSEVNPVLEEVIYVFIKIFSLTYIKRGIKMYRILFSKMK